MRIMIDTNVIISALIFPSKSMDKLLCYVFDNHNLVLSSGIIEETKGVVAYKFPSKVYAINNFFASISYEYQHDFDMPNIDVEIRDEKDKKILSAAIASQVDILITGDKDFFDRKYDGLDILTPADFINRFINT